MGGDELIIVLNSIEPSKTNAMLRTYLRIAARILARNKLYTLINVVGLALGVCVCIIIWLVDSFDLNFDRFHPEGIVSTASWWVASPEKQDPR